MQRKVFFGFLAVFWLFSSLVFARPWWKDAVFYQIFIRSFYDSNGDGIGDFNGVTQKLDYLTNLGVNAIWFLPIHPSPSYHGYDVVDYMAVNPEYGTMEDFERLLAESHRRGIRIILDLVINHSSSQHPWFSNSVARHPDYDAFYVWRASAPEAAWRRPWGGGGNWEIWPMNRTRRERYYAVFWSGMPDLNLKNQRVTEEVFRFTRFWLEKGVDGFRLDAVRYLIETGPGAGQADTPETIAWLERFHDFVKGINSNAVLVGEAWADNRIVSRYFSTNGIMDLCFDFDRASAFLSSDKNNITRVLLAHRRFGAPADFYAPFLANHDTFRAMNQLQHNERLARLAAVTLLTSTGTPFIYYGEEIGMSQPNERDDRFKRMPMPWNNDRGRNFGFTTGTPWFTLPPVPGHVNVADQLRDRNSLLSLYRTLIRIRRQHSEFRSPTLEFVHNDNPNLLVYKRIGAATSWVIVNFSDARETINIAELENKRMQNLVTDRPVTMRQNTEIAGLEFMILREL